MLPWQWMLVEVTEVVAKTMPAHLDCVSSISPVSLLVHLAIRISDLLVAADPNRPHRLLRPLLVVFLLVVLVVGVVGGVVVFLLVVLVGGVVGVVVVLLLVVLVGGLVEGAM